MPFQALPIALRANPGTPISKLAWIYCVQHADVIDPPNGRGWISAETEELVRFCQASEGEVFEAMDHLIRCGLVERITWKDWGEEEAKREFWADLNLPKTQMPEAERKRFKASPDQLELLASRQRYVCAGCGFESEHWHADHIIPRSIGGADTEENMQALCPTCNARKSVKIHFVDFLGGRR